MATKLLLEAHLKALRLPTFLLVRQTGAVRRRGSLDSWSFLRLELLDREQRATERRIAAKFPVRVWDTSTSTSFVEQERLARCEFIDRRENVGTG